MIRHFSLLTLFCCALFLTTGCGTGGEAKYDASKATPQTQEELDADKEYEELMKKQASENEDSGN